MLGGDAAVRRRRSVAPSISLYLLKIYRCAPCVTKLNAQLHQKQRTFAPNFTKSNSDRHQNQRSFGQLHQNKRTQKNRTSPKPTHSVTKANAALDELHQNQRRSQAWPRRKISRESLRQPYRFTSLWKMPNGYAQPLLVERRRAHQFQSHGTVLTNLEDLNSKRVGFAEVWLAR